MVDDQLTFVEETGKASVAGGDRSWTILIVDDDESVHQATNFALEDFHFEDRGLRILHAYSSQQAKALIADEPDIAVVLLDVVMESVHGGLDLAAWIRDELDNHRTRIVLRTGQPGFAPEMRVVRDYDINDYREKGDLTAAKLVTSIYAALRSFRDIVRIEEQSSRIRTALEAAELANRAKTDFITHMSHEFRTPLNGILGLSEIIASETFGPIGNPKYLEYAWDIVASGRRLQTLLESVLELTESGDDAPLTPETFDLRELIGEVLDDRAGMGSVQISDPNPHGPERVQKPLMLKADRRAVRKMLSNLVSNALSHNPPNCRVRVTARAFPDGRLTLSVIDDGNGVPAEVLERFGDPFNLYGDPYVTGSGRLGLGWAATRRLIEQHGGHMTVKSKPGSGTTVRLTFPP